MPLLPPGSIIPEEVLRALCAKGILKPEVVFSPVRDAYFVRDRHDNRTFVVPSSTLVRMEEPEPYRALVRYETHIDWDEHSVVKPPEERYRETIMPPPEKKQFKKISPIPLPAPVVVPAQTRARVAERKQEKPLPSRMPTAMSIVTLYAASRNPGEHKQWSIWIDPADPETVTTEWGRVGWTLQRANKRFMSRQEAETHLMKLVQSKRDKGYKDNMKP